MKTITFEQAEINKRAELDIMRNLELVFPAGLLMPVLFQSVCDVCDTDQMEKAVACLEAKGYVEFGTNQDVVKLTAAGIEIARAMSEEETSGWALGCGITRAVVEDVYYSPKETNIERLAVELTFKDDDFVKNFLRVLRGALGRSEAVGESETFAIARIAELLKTLEYPIIASLLLMYMRGECEGEFDPFAGFVGHEVVAVN